MNKITLMPAAPERVRRTCAAKALGVAPEDRCARDG